MTNNVNNTLNLPSTDSLGETTYIVLEDFGRFGQAYRETDPDRSDFESVIEDFLTGQFERPLRVVAFNLATGWARDVSRQIADELHSRQNCKAGSLRQTQLDFWRNLSR